MGLSSLEVRSLENPNTSLSNPASWLSEALGAGPTTSGVAVNEATAMRYAAAFGCINAISKDVAQIPIKVHERKGENREDAREHNIWRILHNRPNPMMAPFTLKQTMQAHAVSWGNGYAEIEYNNRGGFQHLWPLLPDRTKIQIKGGKKWVVTRVREEDGSEQWLGLPPERVIHIPGLGFDGLRGYSVISLARNAIGAGMAAEEFSARLFSNGASPRIALSHPKTLTDPARKNLELSWNAAYGGLSNAHRTAILEEGVTVEKIGLPAKDQQMIESSTFSIEQMARFFDVPLMRLHSTAPITSWGTGLEQWQRAYLKHTLNPWLVLWEEVLNWSLFDEKERLTYYAEFLREALLQADFTARATFYNQLFQIGSISPNEIARKENLPTAGPAGDKRFVMLNMVPLEDAGKPLSLPAPGSEPDAGDEEERSAKRPEHAKLNARQLRSVTYRQRTQNAYARVYHQVADRLTTKHVERTKRQVKKLAEDGNLAAFKNWVQEFFEGEREGMQAAYLPVTSGLAELIAADVLAELGSQATFKAEVERSSERYVESLANREAFSSIGQLHQIADNGDTADGTMAENLTRRLDSWTTTRPDKIAMREPVQAGNATARHVYELSGVVRLMWIATGNDTCAMCQTMNGRVVSIERPFVAAGETIGDDDKHIIPEQNVAAPPLHGGCGCQIVAA